MVYFCTRCEREVRDINEVWPVCSGAGPYYITGLHEWIELEAD